MYQYSRCFGVPQTYILNDYLVCRPFGDYGDWGVRLACFTLQVLRTYPPAKMLKNNWRCSMDKYPAPQESRYNLMVGLTFSLEAL